MKQSSLHFSFPTPIKLVISLVLLAIFANPALSTTNAAPPLVTTQHSWVQTATEAVVYGQLNPVGLETTYYYEYGVDQQYGSKTPDQILPASNDWESDSTQLSGLQPTTTYHYRLVATNADGTSRGNDQTFSTSIPPYVHSLYASVNTATEVDLSAYVDTSGYETTAHFEYGLTDQYGNATADQVVAANNPKYIFATLSNLQPGKTYHYRVAATSAGGSFTTADETFTTAPPPIATTLDAGVKSATEVEMVGGISPKGFETNVYFDYGLTDQYGSVTDSQVVSADTEYKAAKQLVNLQPGKTYHYRVVASSPGGVVRGADKTFTMSIPPAAGTHDATVNSSIEVDLEGWVTPRGFQTQVHFEYGLDTNYGNVTPDRSVFSGNGYTLITYSLTDLKPGTTYHYRMIATSAGGTTIGEDVVFSTPPVPTASTGPATDIAQGTAVLVGTLNPHGYESTYYFEYGTDQNYGSQTSEETLAVNSENKTVNATIKELQAGTTYNYRLVIKSALGITKGQNLTFTTLSKPVVSEPKCGDPGQPACETTTPSCGVAGKPTCGEVAFTGVSVAKLPSKLTKKNELGVRVGCPKSARSACQIKVVAKTVKGAVIGSGGGTLSSGQTKVLLVKFKLPKRTKKLAFKLTVTSQDQSKTVKTSQTKGTVQIQARSTRRR